MIIEDLLNQYLKENLGDEVVDIAMVVKCYRDAQMICDPLDFFNRQKELLYMIGKYLITEEFKKTFDHTKYLQERYGKNKND